MLNLKKGLALVLAAATAFTFAPVANLGQAETANAAANVTNAELVIPQAAYTASGATATVTAGVNIAGYTSIKQAPLADGMEITGLTVKSKHANSVFLVFNAGDVDSYDNLDHDAATDNKGFLKADTSEAALKTAAVAGTFTADAALADNVYTVSDNKADINLGKVYIHKGGTHTITLYDIGPDAKKSTTDGEIINITISAKDNKEEAPEAKLYATRYNASTGVVGLRKLSGGTDTNTATDAIITPQGFTYFLDLNKYEPGYLLSYANNSDSKTTKADGSQPDTGSAGLYYTNWAGSKISVKSIELTASNKSIQWWKPSTDGKKIGSSYSTNLKTTLEARFTKDNSDADKNTYTFDDATATGALTNVFTANKNPNGVIFKTSAATIGTDAIKAKFVGDNGGVLDSSKSDIDFSTDRSTASLDHLYVSVAGGNKTELTADTNGDYNLTGVDVQIANSGKFEVDAESGDHRFISVDPSIISIDEKTGEFKVLKKGSTKINLYLGSTVNNKPNVYTINVTVSPLAEDIIDLSADSNVEFYKLSNIWYLDMDEPGNKSTAPVTTAQIKAVSRGGLDVKFSSSNPSIAEVNEKTGVVTAKKAGTATITVETSNNVAKEIKGTTEYVTVTVWTLPAAQFTVTPDPVTVNVNETALITPNVTLPAKDATYTVNYDNGKTSDDFFDLTNPNSTNTNTQTSSRIKGKKLGTSSVLVTVIGTASTRPTTKRVGVTVLDKTSVNTISVATGSESVVLEEGGTATVTASSSQNKEVTFTSDDPTVATVAATTGSAVVTAVKAGKTTIKAHSEGAEDVVIPVVVTAKETPAKVVDPAAVTGLKVKNKKGAYVSVTWDAQDPSILYRVYKKVGNGSWKAKNVTDPKATLQVKKGAKVTVKVKAFRRDENGKAVWGPKATKAKAFKTDKK